MTAKQVILQRLRDAEHELTFGEYAGREGDIVTGVVQAHDRRNEQGIVLVDLGKLEAVLPPAEQVPGEEYDARQPAQGLRGVAWPRTFRGPQVTLSPHPPEPGPEAVRAGGAGDRRRHASRSPRSPARPGTGPRSPSAPRCPGVNAKGACIGPMGQRVRNVMSELHGEKIDIIDWSDDPATFVGHALSPGAGVSASRWSTRRPRPPGSIVPDYQLSLAIGREGQNARLAARLTGWRIDIRSDAQAEDDAATPSPGVGRPPLRSGAPAASAGGRPAAHRPPPRRAEHPGPATR